ncbi:MAG: hypothetical protein CUN55_01460 [Phototrophicales bacterium]|nr:MAG: hypothetical protein CUN55_01460 [Phototrophicales bacterium]
MNREEFLALAQAAFENPEEADFVVLRQAYVESDIYEPTAHYSYHKLMGQTNSATSFEEVAQMCEHLLEANPMDLEVRMLLDYVYSQLEQHDLAAMHHAFVEGMLRAIFNSGDGRSIGSAWEVVAVAEEYTLLSVMGLRLQRQALVEEDGVFYDVLSVMPRTSDNEADILELYFDITAPFNYLRNNLL